MNQQLTEQQKEFATNLRHIRRYKLFNFAKQNWEWLKTQKGPALDRFIAALDSFCIKLEKPFPYSYDPPTNDDFQFLVSMFDLYSAENNPDVIEWIQTGKEIPRLYDDILEITQDQIQITTLEFYLKIVNQFLRFDVIKAGIIENDSQAHKALFVPSGQEFEHYLIMPHLLTTLADGFASINFAGNIWACEQLKIKPGEKVLDLGGGNGSFLACVASVQPLVGSLENYDLRATHRAIEKSRATWLGEQEQKVKLLSGSFFASGDTLEGVDPSEKYDLINLGWILHDWNDTQCEEILRKMKPHMKPGGRVSVLEVLANETNKNMAAIDFIMKLISTGFERNLTQLNDIFERAGFKCNEVHKNPRGRDLMVLN